MRKQRLLFITYAFPPSRGIGCVRTWNIAKYLARCGWDVTVLTPDPSLWRDVELPLLTETNLEREGIRRLSTDHRWRWLAAGRVKCSNEGLSWLLGGACRRAAWALGIEPSVGWIRPAEQASSILAPGDVDIILASGPPFSGFLLAQRLAGRLQCPYVVDYRDLWSRHLHNQVPAAVRTEASVIAGSASVTIVSPSWARVMERQFAVGPKLHVVSNGYDPEDLATVPTHPFGHFAIVYTGSLWPPKRVISPVMAAVRRLREVALHHERWMFHYYGRHGSHVRAEAERFAVTDKVRIHEMVPRATVLEAVKGAGAAVVITSVEDRVTLEDKGMVTGKIFEAIGLGTPVLVIAPEGSDANVVIDTTGLGRRYSANDVEGIVSFLRDLMEGKSLKPKDTDVYAWGSLVGCLNEVLRGAIKDGA